MLSSFRLLPAAWVCCAIVVGKDECSKDIGTYLNCNNPRVITYLSGLRDSDTGRPLKGVTLSDGIQAFEGLIYLGRVKNVPSGVHLYLFKQKGHGIAYLWVEKGAKEFELPSCPEWGYPESAHVLTGDVYTWSAAQPGAGVIQVDCIAKSWKLQ